MIRTHPYPQRCTICNAALRATDNVTQTRDYTFVTHAFSKEQSKKISTFPGLPNHNRRAACKGGFYDKAA